jgi:hypothetical protein
MRIADESLEDFAELMRSRQPDRENAGFPELVSQLKEAEEKAKSVADTDKIAGLEARMFKLESQIGLILIHLGIDRQDEIIVTSEMPDETLKKE